MIISCLVEYTKIISKIYRENLHLPTVNDHSVNGGHVICGQRLYNISAYILLYNTFIK